ncbi:O-antigen ligase family protein [Nonlabens sp. Asnod3-A02]|uniref:O-antigen ligase family protein n=1 Tax=Nonlabens sp. Asnod3-A02 TaxID=3160579 RepID=UPI00386B6B4D
MGFKEKLKAKLPQLLYYLTMVMFLMPVIPRGVRPVFIAFYAIGAVCSKIMDKEPFKWGYFLLNSSLFLMYIVSLSYTEDISYGMRKLSTGVTLLIFPLVIACMSKRSITYILSKRYDLMWLYIIATLILNIGAFIIFSQHYSFDEVIRHFVNIIRSDISGWKIHPIYLSMHICVSIIFSLFLVHKGLNWKKLLVLVIMNLVFIAFLLIMIKKGPIIALILVAAYLVLMFKNIKLYIVFGLGVIGLVSVIIFNPKVNERFSELLQVQDTDASMTNSTNIRYSIYKCVSSVIPHAGITGFGIGDGKNQLINCYQEDSKFLADNRYNSHNQYTGIILYVGYLGLLLFSSFLLYHIVRAFSRKNYLFIAILLFYCVVMFSENILERENGVLFFAFFINLFLMLDYNYEKRRPQKVDKIISF